jgi:hypothetical protein
MTKVLVVEDDPVVSIEDGVYYLDDEPCEYPCCANVIKCDNCGCKDAVMILANGTNEDTGDLVNPGDRFGCFQCGATIEIQDDMSGLALYCRHNRVFEENCVRCEVEGLDLPA